MDSISSSHTTAVGVSAHVAPRDSVLVLGGSGFLGRHVVAAALATGACVHDASRRPVSSQPVARQSGSCQPVSNVGETVSNAHVLDALDFDATRELLAQLAPRCIVLCTALSRLADCERDPAAAQRLNRDWPALVAAHAARFGARLVHVSTDLVFGAPAREGGHSEHDPAAPLSIYGRTKLDGEHAVLAACPAALVVRLPLLYGDSFGRELGASDSLYAACARGERPSLFVDEWRTPLEASCAARRILAAAVSDARGVLHVGGPRRRSRHELALELLEAAGLERTTAAARVHARTREDAGCAATRPADASLSSARALALGIAATGRAAATDSHTSSRMPPGDAARVEGQRKADPEAGSASNPEAAAGASPGARCVATAAHDEGLRRAARAWIDRHGPLR